MSDNINQPYIEGSWHPVPMAEGFRDVTYHRHEEGGIARIAFNRPEVRNAFRSQTIDELLVAFEHTRLDTTIGVVLLTGNGPSPKDGQWAFCSGGDQRVRGADCLLYTSDAADE